MTAQNRCIYESQPVTGQTKSFLYADDLCVAAQSKEFHEVEIHLDEALKVLTPYYVTNHLRANPTKTQVCEEQRGRA